MKRIILFIATNLAVVLVMSIVLSLLGVNNYLAGSGLNLGSLMVFSLVAGFTGAFISLLISKPMAKWSTGARVIDSPGNSTEAWLLNTVGKLAHGAGIKMPEVAVYDGEANAFATGAFRNSALVAVSTGLLQNMNQEEVEAVLAHEISHVANGDMVTMTLLQGVLNTFVIFLARVVGFFVDKALFRNSDDDRPGVGYMITVIVCQILFGLIASMIVAWFSRRREYRADAGSVGLLGSNQPMIHALARLGGLETAGLPQNLATAGISDTPGFSALFSTHPPIQDRIAALQGAK